MKFRVTIYKLGRISESWVTMYPNYYELHRQLEKCEIGSFKIEVL